MCTPRSTTHHPLQSLRRPVALFHTVVSEGGEGRVQWARAGKAHGSQHVQRVLLWVAHSEWCVADRR